MQRLTLALLLAVLPVAAAAQQRDTTLTRQELPRDVANRAVDLYNAANTVRASGAFDVEDGRLIDGNLAVLGGPLTIAGHVKGDVLVVNGNVTLLQSARVDGDLLVVGGTVQGENRANVAGEIRIYHSRLTYTSHGDRIAAVGNETGTGGWWRRFEPHRSPTGSKIQIASAGAYNRVEGLPINLGPQLYHDFPNGSASLDAYAVLRTGSSFRESNNDVGDNLHSEVRLGSKYGILIAAGVYDLVSPVESWRLNDLEAGLAAGLFRRDYRDYYRRHGGTIEAGLFQGRQMTLTLSYSDVHWSPRVARNAWTLFRSSAAWRPNPTLDDAHMHLLDAVLTIDTRSDEINPWSGWYVRAELEHGSGHVDSLGPTQFARTYPAGRPARYDRGFVDVRRYNRVSRGAQINLRLVAGGWLGGDALPLERRLSVDGYGALPGFGFRSAGMATDVATCTIGTAPPGYPAQCERIALAQAEYRSDLHVRLFDWDSDDWIRPHLNAEGSWVVFLDAGRGWMVGRAGAPMTYPSGALPRLSTFRSDLGVGLDFSDIGVYVAKALSSPGQPARVFLRLQHRF